MAVIDAFGELEALGGGVTTFSTGNAGTAYDSTYARGALSGSSGVSYQAILLSDQTKTSLWFHFSIAQLSGGALDDNGGLRWYNTNGDLIADFLYTDGTPSFRYYNAGSPTVISSVSRTLADVDIEITIHGTTGRFAVYRNGTMLGELTGNTDFYSGYAIKEVRFSLDTGNQPSFMSQFIVADESTIGWKLVTLPPTADSGTAEWTGTYAAVDESGLDDGDTITSATAEQTHLMTSSALPGAVAGMKVKALVVGARAKVDGSGPPNLQLAAKSGTTTGVSASNALTTGFAYYRHVFNTNPDTAAAWTQSEINAASFGVKSKA